MSATAAEQATPLPSRSICARKAHSTISVEKMSSCPKSASSSRKTRWIDAASNTEAKGRPGSWRKGSAIMENVFLPPVRGVDRLVMIKPSLVLSEGKPRRAQNISAKEGQKHDTDPAVRNKAFV